MMKPKVYLALKVGPEDIYCLDCGKDTYKSQERYMARDELWETANPKIDGALCLTCLEKRIGRDLVPEDFTDAPINKHQARLCSALSIRFLYGPVGPKRKRRLIKVVRKLVRWHSFLA